MSDLKTVAIIPVRGGSRGIPRKNARLLRGKPLLSYSIEAAMKSDIVDIVYVSTDDDELAEIARRSGAKVLERPQELAEDNVTLDEVIVNATCQIEQGGVAVGQVVTIQATCPLITYHTIDAVCSKQAKEEFDTVLTVVNDTHLGWGYDDDGRLIPLYKERSNRQLLPPFLRETGGVVACFRSVIDSGSRFGKNVGVVEISKAEAIDIDDYFDWWLAEKSLARRTICFNVIGNRQAGLGHVYRALTLADHLIDHDVCFMVNDQSLLAAKLIEQHFYPVMVVEEGKEGETIVKGKYDLVINDILNTDESFVRLLKEAGMSVVNFEDVGSGSLFADCLINAMYNSHPTRQDEGVLHGVRYCCLRDEFYSIEPKQPEKDVKNVLVLFGGTDPNNMTLKCLRWLDSVKDDWKITVITGVGYQNVEEVKKYAASTNHEIEVVCDTSIISGYMAMADLAITSAGRTVFELASLGVPMMVIAQNDREMEHEFARCSVGVKFCGRADELNREVFLGDLQQLLESDMLRAKMREVLLSSGVRDGIYKVIGAIKAVVRQSDRR